LFTRPANNWKGRIKVTTFIARRLIQAVVVLFLVTLLVFFAMRLLPGDPIRMLVSQTQEQEFNAEQLAALRHQYGLDLPLYVQYFQWVGNLVLHGDLGDSILNHISVVEEIAKRIPITFHLGIIAFALGLVIGIPAGIVCAVRRGTWIDTVVTTLSNLGITVPNFWLGVLLMYLFGLYLHWLPIMGYTSPFTDFWQSTRQLVMPVFCLTIFPISGIARQTRSSMLEVMRQDYIRTAWSKGLKERMIISRHALKNGLIPIVTFAGMGIPVLLGGSVLIETVFSIPGMGRLAVSSLMSQDYPYVQAITLIMAGVVVLSNLLVDIIYGWLDPRVRYS
jgi:peptide/nickel transport system permease protein